MFGLAQLYQLRGRVGRSERQAYCYLIVPEYTTLTADAKTRLQTLGEFTRLGSGFRIAAVDMELRGSGNALGAEQSGQVAEVGFDLYCRMLEKAVAELKGEAPQPEERRATIELNADILIPEDYISETDQRLGLYRKVSSARSEGEIDSIIEEIRDRYGALPEPVLNLIDYGRLSVKAESLGISKIARDSKNIIIKLEKDTILEPEQVYDFVSRWEGTRFLADGRMIIPLDSSRRILNRVMKMIDYLSGLQAEQTV